MTSSATDRKTRFGLILLVVVAGSLLFPGAAQAGNGVCTTAEIEEPFRLPGGQLRPPARLTLCDEGDYSPVATFHKVRVDGRSVTMLTSRREASEDGGEKAPFLMFRRERDGRLVLLGYAYPDRGGMKVHAFPTPKDRIQAAAEPGADALPPILVAARID